MAILPSQQNKKLRNVFPPGINLFYTNEKCFMSVNIRPTCHNFSLCSFHLLNIIITRVLHLTLLPKPWSSSKVLTLCFQTFFKHYIPLFHFSPGLSRCPPRRRSQSVRFQHCNAPPMARALSAASRTPEPWRGSWERRPEIPGRQSLATWYSESDRSPATPPSTEENMWWYT